MSRQTIQEMLTFILNRPDEGDHVTMEWNEGAIWALQWVLKQGGIE